MINCGATIDLADFLKEELEDDVVIFVADSHRLIDVCNAYSASQIRLITTGDEEEDIPEYNTVFIDDSDDNNDDNSGGSEEDENGYDDENVDYGNNKRRRYDEKSIMKRRDRRIWEEERSKILFDYQQFSFIGPSTAVLMYELALKMSRDDNDLLWWSIIGHTEQLLMLKSEVDKYLIGSGNLRDHVSRLDVAPSSSSEGENSRSIGSMKLTYQ